MDATYYCDVTFGANNEFSNLFYKITKTVSNMATKKTNEE